MFKEQRNTNNNIYFFKVFFTTTLIAVFIILLCPISSHSLEEFAQGVNTANFNMQILDSNVNSFVADFFKLPKIDIESIFSTQTNDKDVFSEKGESLFRIDDELSRKLSDSPKPKSFQIKNEESDFLISPEMSSEINKTQEEEPADQKSDEYKGILRRFNNFTLIDP
jgi:hypothetical protein